MSLPLSPSPPPFSRLRVSCSAGARFEELAERSSARSPIQPGSSDSRGAAQGLAQQFQAALLRSAQEPPGAPRRGAGQGQGAVGERAQGGRPARSPRRGPQLAQRTRSMRSSSTTPIPAGAADTASAPIAATLLALRPPPGGRAAADCGAADRARTHRLAAPAAAPRRRRAARRAGGLGLRLPRPGGGRDDERPQPHLAPRHGRARE